MNCRKSIRSVSRPLSDKQEARILRICSVIIYPLEKKFIGTSSIWQEVKVVCCLPSPFLHTASCQVVTGTAVIFHLAGRQDRQCLSFEYNLQCPLLVTQLFPPLPRMFQWLRLLPYLNLLFVQASDISNSLQKAKTYVICAWIVLI